MWKEILELFLKFFKELSDEKKETKVVATTLKKELLKYGSKNAELVKYAKKRLLAHGFGGLTLSNGNFLETMELTVKKFQKAKGLTADGVIGPKTWQALEEDVSNYVPPKTKDHMEFFEKYKGKKETDSVFNKFMSTFWPKFYNPKTIIGIAAAWCGIFAYATFDSAGYKDLPKNYIAAIAWDGYGHEVNWRQDGIARGAAVRINSSGNCKSSSGNHITMANGDCTAKDLTKSDATIGGAGGNQNNSVKVSIYKMKNVCYVGWPKEKGLPPKVTKSNNCTGTGSTDESTR